MFLNTEKLTNIVYIIVGSSEEIDQHWFVRYPSYPRDTVVGERIEGRKEEVKHFDGKLGIYRFMNQGLLENSVSAMSQLEYEKRDIL